MVSISPRVPDDLDYDEPTDHRLVPGFHSSSLDSIGYEEHESQFTDLRPLTSSSMSTPERPAAKRDRQKRHSDRVLQNAPRFRYLTRADGNAFRLLVLHPGTGLSTIYCELIWEDCRHPSQRYECLSYSWETTQREALIIVDDHQFSITTNLLAALYGLRKAHENILIWVDQICINQDDHDERCCQVSIMKYIFKQAKAVTVWLGEEADRSEKLCEYARKMSSGKGGSNLILLKRILNPRQLQEAIGKLLQRPWFQRTWVVPEVALANFTVVAIGNSHISWDNLVKLIRDTQPPPAVGFEKQTSLLGNARQRIAIITQMRASQSDRRLHTDITQQLILAKSSGATDDRDKVYAFYSLALLTTVPHYNRSIELLYVEVAEMYVNAIQHEHYYSTWHNLNSEQLNLQLMSILYSAGALHQHKRLPSWVPDWTYSWHLAPLWAKTISNVVVGSSQDCWTSGIRGEFRAGGPEIRIFEIIEMSSTTRYLRVSAILVGEIVIVDDILPISPTDQHTDGVDPQHPIDLALFHYGRTSFKTSRGLSGIATPGVRLGDKIAILLGGDVPVVIRSCGEYEPGLDSYWLLCECYLFDEKIMQGTMVLGNDMEASLIEDIVFV